MIRVYVAGPYSKGDVVLNVRRAILAGDELLRKGYVPYVPHLSHFWHLVMPHGYDDWMDLDLAWLSTCHCLLRLPGESSGADVEVDKALDLGMPVYYSMDALEKRREGV